MILIKLDYNLNNGPIQLNSSSGSFSIIRNINNGYIINNVLTSDITDTIEISPDNERKLHTSSNLLHSSGSKY
jgi:hypothetical protein